MAESRPNFLIELPARAYRSTIASADGNVSPIVSTDTYGSQLLALDVCDRQDLVDDYAAGMHKPRTPTSVQECLRKFVVSYKWLIVQVSAISVDVYNLFFQETKWSWIVATSALYVVDIVMRMMAMGSCEYFTKWWNRSDIIIIYVATVGAFLENMATTIRILRVGRILFVFNQKLRHITGQNKQRFLSPENDLDIDLAYITPNLIAMSVPAEDYITRLYRNDINDVVRFFHLFHMAHFHIMNLCPELPYNASAFGSNPRTKRANVDTFNIQDHTPPLMDDFLRFFKIARIWMSEHDDNIMAIHCRGGKGRTGSMCCAWLLYNRQVEHAQDALNFYALARTDINKVNSVRASNKLQGVETPSQVRYLRYIDQMLTRTASFFPKPVLPPKISRLRVQQLCLHGMFQKEKGQRLVAAIHVPSFETNQDSNHAAWKIIYWSPEVQVNGSIVEMDLGDVIVSKDTRISVFKADAQEKVRAREGTHMLAGTEPGCLFYFLFHTFFHRDDTLLQIPRREVDKAWKNSKYKDNGFLTLHYAPAPYVSHSSARKLDDAKRRITLSRLEHSEGHWEDLSELRSDSVPAAC